MTTTWYLQGHEMKTFRVSKAILWHEKTKFILEIENLQKYPHNYWIIWFSLMVKKYKFKKQEWRTFIDEYAFLSQENSVWIYNSATI